MRPLEKEPIGLPEWEGRYLEPALEQARTGLGEGGIPIGAVLVTDGSVLGAGRNRRIQLGSATRHGEIDALENAGRLAASVYRKATLYTTLSPCDMCSGAILLYGIPRVVIGDNTTFLGSEQLLAERGVQVIQARSEECRILMETFIRQHPGLWSEDIGE